MLAQRIAPAFVALAACVTSPADQGQLDQAIVGGSGATTATYPTVVGLQHGSGNYFCTGVLVDKDWILTTASCFDGNTGATQARFDDSDFGDGSVDGPVIEISEIHLHPSFDINSTTWIHDVAVLKLSQSVTDRTPTPIHRDAMTVGTSVTQVGFGASSSNGNGEGVLRSLSTTSLDCAQAGDSGISNTNVLCFDASDGSGSCYGDGGAPALINGTTREVAGLASGGTGSSCTSGYDIYTSLAAELSFVDTYVPHTTQPPSGDPNGDGGDTPDPGGSGSGDPRDPTDPDTGSNHHPVAVGCNAGGHGASGLVVGLGAMFVLRRRRRRT